MPTWKPGQSGNPKGRPKGRLDNRARTIAAVARRLLEDPAYQQSLQRRLAAGTAPHMETLLHHYAYGKPVERIEHSVLIRQVAEQLARQYDLDVETLIAEAQALSRGGEV